jgi:uncharacterized BrkB/YihY/UPF0761 family membrane protein
VKWLVRLYPPAWRRRYETEFLAVLEARGVTPSVTLDVTRGALDAWLRGPRGDLGVAGIGLALVAYALASWILAIARRAWVEPLGDPLETVYQAFYWGLSILFMTWLAARPNVRCDVSGIITRLRR